MTGRKLLKSSHLRVSSLTRIQIRAIRQVSFVGEEIRVRPIVVWMGVILCMLKALMGGKQVITTFVVGFDFLPCVDHHIIELLFKFSEIFSHFLEPGPFKRVSHLLGIHTLFRFVPTIKIGVLWGWIVVKEVGEGTRRVSAIGEGAISLIKIGREALGVGLIEENRLIAWIHVNDIYCQLWQQISSIGMEISNEKELLREQFELISANIKCILHKHKDKITSSDKDFLLSAIKKVIFIKNSFDIKTSRFAHILKGMGVVSHPKNGVVFEKGDQGQHFFIVLEGVYCVEIDNLKEGKKEKQIYYYPGDSFGEVSLIYDVPRGTRIVAHENSSLITIQKQNFNECGDLRKNILYLNDYFQNHTYFQNESKFMIRVVSSISKLQKFTQNQIIIDEGSMFHEILFFVKGQAKVFKTLPLEGPTGPYTETIEIQTLSEGGVYGEHFYTNKIPSTVRITGMTRGEFIRVNFKDDVHTVENALYKRIRQNALRFPTDEELFDQFLIYLNQKAKQLEYLLLIYKNDGVKGRELAEVKQKIKKISRSKLIDKLI